MRDLNQCRAQEKNYGAQIYDPLPICIERGEGLFLWDTAGKRYFDMLSAYSAVSHGHCHPELVRVVNEQSKKLTLTSRAMMTQNLGDWYEKICTLTRMDRVLPMNTGAESVETAIKAARKWGVVRKGLAEDQAEIIVAAGNFHGRTTTIISMSTEPQYRRGFGPFTPGFKSVPFGDLEALKAAITPQTVAFLIEPIQGEGGIVPPKKGFLHAAAELCREQNVLLIVDEIQCGLGRTGKVLASWHEDVQPDGLILGKSLGGGFYPVSAFLAKEEFMSVFEPGDHGSTFGGNPLAMAISLRALELLEEEKLIQNSERLGQRLLDELRSWQTPLIKEVRGLGLFVGIEIAPQEKSARQLCLELLELGLITKDTHKTTLRLAPPLIINEQQLDEALGILKKVLV